jgi:hypothetical protein
VGSPFIAFVAIGPAILIGLITGRIIYAVAKSKFMNYFSKSSFTLISIFICTLIALLIHAFFRIKFNSSFEAPANSYLSFGFLETYLFTIGIPTIIYIIAGRWFGWKIYSKLVI